MKKSGIIVLCIVLLIIPMMGCVSVSFGGVNSGLGAGVTGRGSLEIFSFENMGEIREIRVSILCNIEHFTTPSDIVTLEIQPNLIDYITVTESNGILEVRSNRSINWSSGSNIPILTIGSDVLSRVVLTGAGTFTAHDIIEVDTFDIEISGAANGQADLNVNSVNVRISGAGDVRLSGRADRADLTLAGAGRLEALELQTAVAFVNLAGAGTVRLSCSEHLTIVADGVGTVEYRGSPRRDISRSGLVSIRNID